MHQAIIDNQYFIYYLFNVTAGALYGLSQLTSLSYQFWNIVIWFGLIPATWIYLVSKKTTVWLNLISATIFIYLFAIHTWNIWFDKAVILLYKIGGVIQSDYKLTSVLICVVVPVLVYFILFALFTSRKAFKRFAIITAIIAAFVIIMFPVSNMLILYYLGYAVQ